MSALARLGRRGGVDLSTHVGSLGLKNPVMTASGTSGHGAELAPYGDLGALGAVVVKSLTARPWPGNPSPRLHHVGEGVINSVGLEGPGVTRWLQEDLPALLATGAQVVVSIWGRSVEEFAETAALLEAGLAPDALRAGVVAVEVNVSCPNLEDRSRMFAHRPESTAAAVAAAECGLPRWAKLSPNVADIVEIATAAVEAGAEALTLTNTLLGLALDVERRRPVLGAGAGGLSGPPLRAVALRAVWDCRHALKDVGIIGVGGIERGVDAAAMLIAGADALQVGTATFRDPRAPWRVLAELERFAARQGMRRLGELREAPAGAPQARTSASRGGVA